MSESVLAAVTVVCVLTLSVTCFGLLAAVRAMANRILAKDGRAREAVAVTREERRGKNAKITDEDEAPPPATHPGNGLGPAWHENHARDFHTGGGADG